MDGPPRLEQGSQVSETCELTKLFEGPVKSAHECADNQRCCRWASKGRKARKSVITVYLYSYVYLSVNN